MRVPTFEPQINPNAGPTVRVSEAVPNTEGVIAGGLDHIGKVVQQVQLNADRTAVTAADTQREQWVNNTLYDPQNGAFTKEGKNAIGVTPQTLEAYDKHVTETASGLTNKRQQKAYTQMADQGRSTLQSQLSRYELTQHNAYDDQVSTARVGSAIQSGALNYNDVKAIDQSRNTINAVLLNQRDSKGWDATTFDAAKQKAYGDLSTNVVERMVSDKRLDLAKGYLSANNTDVSAPEKLRLTKLIDATQREIDAEAKRNQANLWADMAPRVQDTSAAYIRGLDVPNAPTLDELAAARPDDAHEIYNSLQRDRLMGKDLQSFATKSPQELEAEVGKYAVTQGGTGAKDSLARFDEVRQAAAQSLLERQKNPAGFVLENNLGWAPLQMGNKGAIQSELQKRATTQAAVSHQIGVPVPLLAPDEAKQISGMLNEATHKQTLETYDLIKNTVNPLAYRSIMQQIQPDSPVKAYAGQLYGKQDSVTLDTHMFGPDDKASLSAVAETILTGENLINKSKAQKGEDGKPVANLYTPPKAEFDAAFARLVGDAFAGREDAQNLAQQVAYAYYAGKSAQTGRLNKETVSAANVDPGLLNESLRATMGQVVNYHGYGNALAPLGMNQSDFTDRVEAGFTSALQARGLSEAEILNAKYTALPSLGLRNYGNGTYMLTKGKQPFSLQGQPLIVSVQ